MELNPYACYLNGHDPIGHDPLPVLSITAARLRTLTNGLTCAQVSTPPAPLKWSICEIAAHLADCEIVFSFRLRQTLAPALALFQAARDWNLLFLKTVSPDDRHRPTTHPERGTMPFWVIVETMAGHDINHLQQVERIAANPPA
jgi:hypothetical protein